MRTVANINLISYNSYLNNLLKLTHFLIILAKHCLIAGLLSKGPDYVGGEQGLREAAETSERRVPTIRHRVRASGHRIAGAGNRPFQRKTASSH